MPPIPYMYGRAGSMAGGDFGKSAHLVLKGSGYDRPAHQAARVNRLSRSAKLGGRSVNRIRPIVPHSMGAMGSRESVDLGMRVLRNPTAGAVKRVSKLF